MERGKFGTASVMSLKALGPQDEYTLNKDQPVFEHSIRQYTDFSIDQITLPFGNNPYPGTVQRVEIDPRTFGGDLISNMHLALRLPKIETGNTFTENIGRALIKSFTLSLNEQVIETVTSDWLVVRDQIFLDDDEKTAMGYLINGGYSINTDEFKKEYSRKPFEVDIIIPLEFFFSRRHSPYRRTRDRTTRPFFPICAVKNQKVYVTIEFNNASYFTNYEKPFDFVNQASLVIESITLTQEERLKYLEPMSIVINKVYREPQTDISTAAGRFNLTVNFPVTSSFWFFRKKNHEKDTVDVFDSHFKFGYTYTENIIYKARDPFEYLTFFVNNKENTPAVEGKNFFKYLQPVNYNLSTPTNEIYMYSFGITPKEYNTGGSMDFSKIPSKSTYIIYKMDKRIAYDVETNYTFNMYHYGYNMIRFSDGYASLVFL